MNNTEAAQFTRLFWYNTNKRIGLEGGGGGESRGTRTTPP